MSSQFERISALRAEILLLDERLSWVTAGLSKTSSGEGGGRGGEVHAPPPWNAAAALCRLDLHALAREIECDWRRGIGLPVRKRGGSDANTREALQALERMTGAVEEELLAEGLRELGHWSRQAQMVLGELERPRRIPVNAGEKEPGCPFCEMRTLRLWAGEGTVRCVNPGCVAVARAEWNGERLVMSWEGGDDDRARA